MILPYSDKEKKKAHEYYLKNKKAYARRSREYAVKNRERVNQTARERRAKHPEKYRVYQRNWQRKNSDKTQRYYQTYVSKPGIRKKRNVRYRKWADENPEKIRQRNQNPKWNQMRVDIHRNHRIECLKIYSKRLSNSSEPICSKCGYKDTRFLTVDHIHGVTSKDGRGGSALIEIGRAHV